MKALLGQLPPTDDPDSDAAGIADAIDRHPDADLAIFPELFIGGYETEEPEWVAIDRDGPELTGLGRKCAENGTALIVGFTERTADSGCANSAACIDRNGELVTVYRKTHLFGDAEKSAFEPGDELLVTGLAGTAVGPLICFDVEFPEPARMLAGGGARLLVTIAANMRPYEQDHRIAAQARALDNRLPHIYVNRTGNTGPIDFVGGTCLIGSDGTVLEDFGETEGIFEISLEIDAETDPVVDYLKQVRHDLVISTHNVSPGGGA